MNKNRLVVTGFAMLVVSASVWAQSLTSEVRTTYDRFRTAVERFDTQAVTDMLEPGFSLRLPNGQLLARAAYLKGLEDRQSIGTGTPTHSFKLTSVRESNGVVTANVVLTLNSKFLDGNAMTHSLNVVEHKILRFRRQGGAIKVASIEATEVRTSIDGRPASVLKRQ